MARIGMTRAFLPEAVTFLGVLGACVLHDPNAYDGDGRLYEFRPKRGSVLMSDADGRQLYIVTPRPATAPHRRKLTDQAIRAAHLYERFTHRDLDAFHNCAVPAFRRPRFAGELVILRYRAEKDLDELEPEERTGIVEFEHYFEQPGVAPAYPQVFAVGSDQFWIPPGPFAVEPEGITYAAPPEEDRGT